MADPISIIAVASTVFSAVGAIRQGQAQSDAANYNAQVAQQNAAIARNQTEAALVGQRRTSTKALGDLRANYSASGVSMEGSPLDVLEESVRQSELERQNIRYQGELKARGYTSDANLYSANASNARQASYLNAASIALSGGAKASSYSSGTLNRAPVEDRSTGYGRP